ncbi:MAG: hypothetical protein J6W52_12250 [Bacteroidaceae bacterium]|nr:hypothetical protein [Bacteroidaceae bacterium]
MPIEGDVYYEEDVVHASTMRNSSRKALPSDWNITSTIENCFDKDNIGEYAWLMTADGETKLAVTLTYSGDDDRYKISSQEVKFYFYEGTGNVITDSNKEQITETGTYVGNYTLENTDNSATVQLTAPANFPDRFLSSAYYSFYVIIKVKFAKGGSAQIAKNIGISRCGVLFLHGLGGDKTCFQKFANYLIKSGAYISKQLMLRDYNTTNSSAFYDNTHKYQVVKFGLEALSDGLFYAGIASTKYDMIGHSMGGILERLYIQEVDNLHTNKLITLNTPHFGSLWGDTYVEVKSHSKENMDNKVVKLLWDAADGTVDGITDLLYDDDPSRQAIVDLAVSSKAIQELNSTSADKLTGIPVCAVGSQIDNIDAVENDVWYVISEPFYEVQSYVMEHLFNEEVPQRERRFQTDDEEGSDLIVGVESQRGGCAASAIYKGYFHEAFHTCSPNWSVIHKKLLELLNSNRYFGFSYGGFGRPSNGSWVRENRAKANSNYITHFEEPRPSSFIKIDAIETYDDNYTHEIRLTHSNDMKTIMACSFLSKDDMIADYDKDTMYFDIRKFEGEKTVYAIGRTDYNALVIDSVKISTEFITSIPILKGTSELQCTINGNELKVEDVSEPYNISIYDSNGSVLTEMRSNPSHTYTLPRNNGILIIEVQSKEGSQKIKVKTKTNK